VQGSPVMLDLRAGRGRCGNGRCVRKIFTERVPKLATPWAQRTNRLHDVVRLIGHGMGGRPGERLLARLGMAVSDDTILRAVKRVNVDTGGVSLRVVGVDDRAWKKRQTYGTISGGSGAQRSSRPTSRTLCGIFRSLACPAPGDRIHQPGSTRFIRRRRSQRCASGAADCRPLSPRPQSEHRGRAGVSAPSFVSIPTAARGQQRGTCEDGGSGWEGAINRQRIVQGRRDAKQALFETVRALHASGQTVSHIVRETGIRRNRATAWAGVVELPERSQTEPTPRTPAFF
jgi:hypothetical protein